MSSGQLAYTITCHVACLWCDWEGTADVAFDSEADDSGIFECPNNHYNELPAWEYTQVRRTHV